MPPAWTPEKHNQNEYGTFNETENTSELNGIPGFRTPLKHIPEIPERSAKSQREDYHMKRLLKSIPKLGTLFTLHRQIGEGTFSCVFVASLLDDLEQRKLFAIKHLIPTTHPKRIEIELRCLKLIGGESNVVGLDLCMRENESIIFVMPYLPHEPFSNYVSKMDVHELALYLRNLLQALKRVHSFGIIHRDVKPSNFLYDRKNQKFLLVDFGLAQSSSHANDFNTRKRKREDESDEDNKMNSKRVSYKRNVNCLQNTATYLHNVVNNIKENTVCSTIKKSPLQFPTQSIGIKKSPYKFPNLDLPPTHSTFQIETKMPAQRQLFNNKNEDKFVFQKPNALFDQLKPKSNSFQSQNECKCFGNACVCNICLMRKAQDAPRAGTPGFRPPEVLLKYQKQTTAVDIWAVGVIMLSILSGTYPFFRAPNDNTALAEIITLFGDEKLKKTAKLFGQHLICHEIKKPLDLRSVCCKLRLRNERNLTTPIQFPNENKCNNCKQFEWNCVCAGTTKNRNVEELFPDSAYDLLEKLLDVNPFTRITAEKALNHHFLMDF